MIDIPTHEPHELGYVAYGPTLQSKARTGKRKYWRAGILFAHAGKGLPFLIAEWWQDGSVRQTSVPKQVDPKNVGKANETTFNEQAGSELRSWYNRQRLKGYSEDGTVDHVPTKPMLAHKYKDKQHKLSWPVMVQPKYNGFRMLYDGDRAWTRGGKDHNEQCVAHLTFDTEGYTLDGELMLPGNLPLQQTAQAAKKYRPGVSETLVYWVYDVVIPDMMFRDRYQVLKDLARTFPPGVKLVPTVEARNEDELMERHLAFTADGYEGSIVRSPTGLYEIGHRSPSLLKLKDFLDDEYEIIDVIDGVGSFVGKAILVCKTPEGKTFKATPEGTMEYRASLYKNRGKLLGKLVTVRYQELTKDGIPQFPVATGLRDPDY